jgi:hypothetical protein
MVRYVLLRPNFWVPNFNSIQFNQFNKSIQNYGVMSNPIACIATYYLHLAMQVKISTEGTLLILPWGHLYLGVMCYIDVSAADG